MKIIIRLVPPKVTARLRHLGNGKDWDLLVKEGSRVVSRTKGHRSASMADMHLDKILKENKLTLSKGGYDYEEPMVSAMKRWRKTKQGRAVFDEKLKASWRSKHNPDGWRRKQRDSLNEVRFTARQQRQQTEALMRRISGSGRTRKDHEMLASGNAYVGSDNRVYMRQRIKKTPQPYLD